MGNSKKSEASYLKKTFDLKGSITKRREDPSKSVLKDVNFLELKN